MSILETCETFRLSILAETGKAPISVVLYSEGFDHLKQEIPEPEYWDYPLMPPAPDGTHAGIILNGTVYLRGI